MRILCTVCIRNRKFSNQPVGLGHHKAASRFVKATLALCKQPKSENEYCILLFTSANKTGSKYVVNNNISNILTRFIGDGKATIQFKEPEHDLFVQSDAANLKQFLVLLKKILQGKLTPGDMKVSSIGVTALNHNTLVPTKLSIKSRSEYPLKGFPKSLEVLQINDVQRLSFDRGILKLQHLRALDLSNNAIEVVPEEISQLEHLTEINFSNNRLGASAPRKWDWISGRLSLVLKSLNLSNNQMRYAPDQLARLHHLVALDLSVNDLQSLPSGIGNLQCLKICIICNNRLISVPGSMKLLKLDLLDVSSNDFNTDEARVQLAVHVPKPIPMQTLREHSGRTVLLERLDYSKDTLPVTLIAFLETARYCVCGKACFDNYIANKDILRLQSITKTLRMSGRGSNCIPVDLCYCSMQCFAYANRRCTRRVLIR